MLSKTWTRHLRRSRRLAAIAEPAASPPTGTIPSAGRGEVVGREVEKAALREEFAVAAGGRATMVCVSGEPGIGKTTLVEDFLSEMARSSSHLVARGRCSERLAGAEVHAISMRSMTAPDDPARHSLPSNSTRHVPAQNGSLRYRAGLTRCASIEERLTESRSFVGRYRERSTRSFIEDIHWLTLTVDLLVPPTRLGSISWRDHPVPRPSCSCQHPSSRSSSTCRREA